MAGQENLIAQTLYQISLVIPAFNEEAGIAQAIAEANEALAKLCAHYEILVVDDGSSDQTAQVVFDASQTNSHVRLLRHQQNKGYAAALRTGFEAARFELVAFTDADCQFYLDDLARLLPLARDNDVVTGYRIDRKDPALRRFVSWSYNRVVRLLMGTRVRDCDCALKVFRKEALKKLLPESQGFFVNTEMFTRARQQDFRVAEVGVRHRPRAKGESKVALNDIPKTLKTLLPFWWSQVLFAGGAKGRPNGSCFVPFHNPPVRLSQFQTWPCLFVLMVVAGLLFFTRMSCPLLEPEESRYAEIPREMLEEGEFLVPVLNGQPYLHKPPLHYWLVMGSYQIFGVHDWSARLVPCLAGFLTVLVSFWWGRKTAGTRAGFLGALMLALAGGFVYRARMLTLDGLLGLWVVAGLATAHVALRHDRPGRWWWLSALFCGLGIMTKGPVALVLVIAPALAFQFLDSRAGRFSWRAWLGYLMIALSIAVPWFALVAMRDGRLVTSFLWTHNFLRFLAPYDHIKPNWYFIPQVLGGMFPWVLLAIPLCKYLSTCRPEIANHRPAALGFYLLAFGIGFVFFSISGCKKAGYLLPALPPLALALGCYLDQVLSAEVWKTRTQIAMHRSGEFVARLGKAATLLTLLTGAAITLLAINRNMCTPLPGWSLVGVLLGLAALCLLRNRNQSVLGAWQCCALAVFALLLVGLHQVLPGYARVFSLRGQVRRYASLAADPQVPVACYPHRWDGVCFYLARKDVRVYSKSQEAQLVADLERQPNTLVFIKSPHGNRSHLIDLLAKRSGTLEFIPYFRRGIVTGALIRARSQPFSLLAQHANSR